MADSLIRLARIEGSAKSWEEALLALKDEGLLEEARATGYEHGMILVVCIYKVAAATRHVLEGTNVMYPSVKAFRSFSSASRLLSNDDTLTL